MSGLGDRRLIGFASDYAGLMQLLRARKAELNVSMLTLDEASGLLSGYCSKLLSPTPIRAVGPVSLGPLLGALGLSLAVYEDVAALKKIERQLEKRTRSPDAGHKRIRHARRKKPRWRFPKGPEHAKIMRARQLLNQSPEERSRIARRAARIRWRRRKSKCVVYKTNAVHVVHSSGVTECQTTPNTGPGV